MTSPVQTIGTGSSMRQDRTGANRLRQRVVIIGFLIAVAIIAVGWNWWGSTRITQAGSLPDSPGVERTADGLHVLDAYLVADPTPGSFAVVCDLVTSSDGPDRLTGVSVGGAAAAGPLAVAHGDAAGLPVTSEHPLRVGPEAGATHITVVGVPHPPAPGSLMIATFSFVRRGPISVQVPVWTSVSGPAGPD
jgi:hypothetical protein